MRIDSSIVAMMAEHVSVREETSRTSATGTTTIDHRGNASIRPDARPAHNCVGRPNLSHAPGVEIYPNGPLTEIERAYSLELESSKSSSLTVSNGSSSVKWESSSSSSLSYAENVQPVPGRLGPIVVGTLENAELSPSNSESQTSGAQISPVPYYDPEKNVIYLSGQKPAEIKSDVIGGSQIDQAFVESLRGLRLVPEAPRSLAPELRDTINEARSQTALNGTRVLPMVVAPLSMVIRQETSVLTQESSSFQATGSVVTDDGRTMSFDIQVSQNQSASAWSDVTRLQQTFRLPNFYMDKAPDKLPDQHYILDTDPQRTKNVLSLLSIGGGLLAIDKNGDGRLSSERELFGANTGDVLSELAAYDEDGNGWIDENDSIFQSLLIWKDEGDGNARLLSLLDADVGAIFLDYQKTSYALGNSQQLSGSTIYLKESGGAEVVHQIDVAR